MGQKQNQMYNNAYFDLYLKGKSLSGVANSLNITRQSVYKAFKKRGYKLRSVEYRDYQIYNGKKFTLRNHGYYALSNRNRCLLHRYIWMNEVGEIPEGWDVHHSNGNKSDNHLSNLACLPKSEHAKHHITDEVKLKLSALAKKQLKSRGKFHKLKTI